MVKNKKINIFFYAAALFLFLSFPVIADDFSEDELFDDDYLMEETTDQSNAVFDPFEPVNRFVFKFNDKLYTYVLTPVSHGYEAVVPGFARTGIHNFFHNLRAPLRIGNNLLQGKIKNAGKETGEFLFNTVLGFLGFIDSAKVIPELQTPNEDLGQTFGKWGIGSGPYLILPFFGPSNLRDFVGLAGETYLNPVNHYESHPDEKLALKGVDGLNGLPPKMDTYKTLKDSAFDPYSSAKNAYFQLREAQINK